MGANAAAPSNEAAQRRAAQAQRVVLQALHTLLSIDAAVSGAPGQEMDGGPLIEGAIGGILCFAVGGDISDDDLKAQINKTIDAVLPQIRMHQAASHRQGGRA